MNDEKTFNKYKQEYKDVKIPDNIHNYIRQGLKEAKASEEYESKKSFKGLGKRSFGKVDICAIILIFTICLRVSPTFAAYISKVPVLKYVVQLIRYDKGLQSAVNNDFIQHIGVSDEKDGVIFTVNDVIIDEERMVIFYSTENTNKDGLYYNLFNVNITGDENQPMNAFYSYGGTDERDEDNSFIGYGEITMSFNEETVIPDIFVISPTLVKSKNKDFVMDEVESENTETKGNEEDFKLIKGMQVKFPVDKSKFINQKKVYEVNKTVEIDEQKITFQSVAISPTRIGIKVEFDPKNTKHIFAFENLKIIDEKGNVCGSISNGVTASLTDEYHRTLYLESNYFDESKELYLTFNSIRALDKNKLEVNIDMENKKVICTPDLELTIESINREKKFIRLNFILENFNEEDENRAYALLSSSFQDDTGKSFSCSRVGSPGLIEEDGVKKNELFIDIPNENYEGLLHFKISDYPSRFYGDIKIKIK